MRRLAAWIAALALPLTAAAQLVSGVSSIGRADIDSVSIGSVVKPTRAYIGPKPVANNRIYTDGESWDPSNTFPNEFDDGYSSQVVTDKAGLTSSSSTYLTINARRSSTVYVCRDDANTAAYTAGWTDTGLDVIRASATFSCLSKTFAAGAISVPGNNGDAGTQQFIIFVRDALKSVAPLGEQAAGTIRFAFSSVAMLDSDGPTTLYVERIDGNSGPASVDIWCIIAGGSCAGRGSLSPSTVSWASGEGGQKPFTFDPDEFAPGTETSAFPLVLTLASGSASVSSDFGAINITDNAPPAATSYYVNPTGTCSDSYTGRSRTFVSGTNGPWCTIGRSNSLTASTTSAIVTWIEAGTYVNQVIAPVAAGNASTFPRRWCPNGGGVELRGPTSGSIGEVIYGASGVNYVDIGFGCSTTSNITINGQCTLVNLGMPTGCRIQRGWTVLGSNWNVRVNHRNTNGWTGGSTATLTEVLAGRLRISSEFMSGHGTPNDGAGQDSGDIIWIDRGISQTVPVLIAPESTTWLEWYLGGHSLLQAESAKVLAYGIIANNSWGAVAGFSNVDPDGNRAWTIHRNALDHHYFDFVINRNGVAIDNPYQESSKLEGTRNTYSNCVIRNIQGYAVMADVGPWNSYMGRGGRIAHCVFDRIGGPILEMRDYGGGPGSRLGGYVLKNGISLRTNQDPECCGSSPWTDEFAHIEMTAGQHYRDILQVHGWTHQNATGNCNDTFVSYGTAGTRPSGGSKVSLSWLMANDPAYFSNITCTTNANIPSGGPAAATDLSAANYITAYTPTAGDALSLGRGVALTTTTSSGVLTTTVPVADAAYFPDPNGWGAPTVGQWAGAYRIHIAGVGNVTYTDVTIGAYPNNAGTITTAVPISYASGAAVNYSISTGSAPNRGIKR